jgi:hypothetical protein
MFAPVGFALVLALVVGCTSAPAPPPSHNYIDKEKGFSLTFSGEWRQWTGGIGSDLEIMPVDQTNPNVFRDTLLVHMEGLAEPMTLDQFFAVKAGAGARAVPEIQYKEIEKVGTTLGSQDARRLIYSMDRDGTPVTSMAWFLVKDGRGYTLLASAASERFEAMRPKFEAVAATFKFEGP